MNWNEKKLGFGLMRLPKDENGKIIVEEVSRMADQYLAAGFTYFDTAYVYEGSEVAFREAVVKRYPRESYTIASKLPAWKIADQYGPKEIFEESLRRCGVEYFDYYLLHSMQENREELYETTGCYEFVRRMKEEGKIRHIGFSFHGSPELLERTLQRHPEMEFVQLQINYVDWDNELIATGRNYEIARKYGKDIVVMEPVKGGFLANVRSDVREILDEADAEASAAALALRFAASLPGVKVVLSGMSSLAQLEENVKLFASFTPLEDAQMDVIRKAGQAILNVPTVPCTSCRYCVEGCPMQIKIPDIFSRFNMLLTFGEHFRPHGLYNDLVAAGSGRAGDCIGCGQCESVCPQHIDIIEQLAKASAQLDV